MGPLAYKLEELFTYGDYRTWNDDERWELIDGVPYCMSPAPSPRHQLLLGELHRQFANWLRGKPCQVFIAPIDVRLAESDEHDDEITTVVQPDLSVICDKSRLDNTGYRGAPELVVEILSPSTAQKDLKTKLARYERAGVREYWIVDPAAKIVLVFILQGDGQYGRPSVYVDTDRPQVNIFPDLEIDLTAVFAE